MLILTIASVTNCKNVSDVLKNCIASGSSIIKYTSCKKVILISADTSLRFAKTPFCIQKAKKLYTICSTWPKSVDLSINLEKKSPRESTTLLDY